MTFDRLTAAAAAALNLSVAERIQFIRAPRWIGYTRARQVLDGLGDLLRYPKTHRMPGKLLVSETNNGKTFILRKFERDNPPAERPESDAFSIPMLLVQTPPVPDEGRLYNAILDKVNAVYRLSDRVEKKAAMVLQILRGVKLGMLAIDEIQAALSGSESRRAGFLNVLRYLSNELMIPIVLAGTKDAFRAIGTERSLENRFEPVVLPAWQYDDEFLTLLSSFEHMTPLREASDLTEPELSRHLYQECEGTLGELAELIRRGAIHAVESGDELISIKGLKRIGWVRPSMRKDAIKHVR
jgi:hypothetical protein